jgi:branched-chain amino acid aminotransferase
MRRLEYSTSTLKIKLPYTADELGRATLEVVEKNRLTECYIRPIAYLGYGIMGVNPAGSSLGVMIAARPWGRYLPHENVDVKTSSWMRIHPRSLVPDAKMGGHYVNSMNAILEIRGTVYHEVLLLDYRGFVAEGPSENVFMVKDGRLKTPKLGSILAGLTRSTVIEIAGRESIPCDEADITPEEFAGADEAFFTGTAAEIGPIRSLDDKLIGDGNTGPVTQRIKEMYSRVVRGKEDWAEKFLSYAGRKLAGHRGRGPPFHPCAAAKHPGHATRSAVCSETAVSTELPQTLQVRRFRTRGSRRFIR